MLVPFPGNLALGTMLMLPSHKQTWSVLHCTFPVCGYHPLSSTDPFHMILSPCNPLPNLLLTYFEGSGANRLSLGEV